MIIIWLFASASIAMILLGIGCVGWAYFMPRNTDGAYRQTGWIVTGAALFLGGTTLGLVTLMLHVVRALPH